MSMWDTVSAEQRPALVRAAVAAVASLRDSRVPEHLRGGLALYFSDGILPGSFLQAVLCNDLREAVRRADPVTLYFVPHVVTWLEEHAPAQTWGSRAAVLAWTTTRARLEV